VFALVDFFFLPAKMQSNASPNPAGNRPLYRIDPLSPQGLQEIFQPTGNPFPFASTVRTKPGDSPSFNQTIKTTPRASMF
jgi:hypothetical protein